MPKKTIAKPNQVAELGQKAGLRDIPLSSGDVVPAETLRAIFKDAGLSLKRKNKAHATVS